ncbi:MAG: acetyltransferase [Pirellulaceae bacterium]|nr:acetyltransferase [Pirellulaceae bacterium]
MKNLILVGAGGFGKELLSILWEGVEKADYRFAGFLDKNSGAIEPGSLDFLLDDQELTHSPILDDPLEYYPKPNDVFLLALGKPSLRKLVTKTLLDKGADFITYRHKTAVVAPTATLGQGTVLYPFSTVSHAAQLGDFTHLSLYASAGHDAKVGPYSYLSPYATLNGNASIGQEVFMATHSSVAPSVHVGPRSIVSSSTPVLREAPADCHIFSPFSKVLTLTSNDQEES